VCGCNDVGDGVILIEEGHKKWFIKKLGVKFLLLELERLLDSMFFVFKLDVLGLCHIEGKNALCVNIF
jgi:hypothetical protein